MIPIPKLADKMRIYIANEKLESAEVLETLLDNREEEEAALLTAKRKVDDVVVSYILPAEKNARTNRLDPEGFYNLLAEMTAKYPKEWREVRDKYEADGITPKAESLLAAFDAVEALVGSGSALAVSTPGYGCAAEALFKMCVGNQLGLDVAPTYDADSLFCPAYGSFIVELADEAELPQVTDGVTVALLGMTTKAYELVASGQTIDLAELQEAWEGAIESVFPYRAEGEKVRKVSFDVAKQGTSRPVPAIHVARPRVVIPVFPGNNCEYDSAKACADAGLDPEIIVVRNMTKQDISDSVEQVAKRIAESQMIFIPGGFSGGDEPDGSAKFITSFFRNEAVKNATMDMLNKRDGLMLGICNGFQALIKLGLVPYGEIRDTDEHCPTLTFNTIGRHQSKIVNIRVASNMSPWLADTEPGDIYSVPISHGEGRFLCEPALFQQLVENGQIATQYVDLEGHPTMDIQYNPNGSYYAVEGITSPDGRVLGKMGHAERWGNGLYKNVPGNYDMGLFRAAKEYFN